MASDLQGSRLEGRVVIVTGGGRGLGAGYALEAARQGARVVVNDVGLRIATDSDDRPPAEALVARIREAGGEATANADDVSSFAGAKALVDAALDAFGRLDVVVNNAGNLRDRMLVNMTEAEFDDVVRVHLKGHFAVSHHAAAHWRERARTAPGGDPVLIQTTSISGLHGNVGQTNYAAAKAGIAGMTRVMHLELNQRLGVRCYAIAPSARTRLTMASPGATEAVSRKLKSGFDFFLPENVAPFVCWLAAQGCPAQSGSVFNVEGDVVRRYDSWRVAQTIRNGGERWTMDALDARWSELMEGADRAFQPFEDITGDIEGEAA